MQVIQTTPITLYCRWLSVDGKAPTEATIAEMEQHLDAHAAAKDRKNSRNERYWWGHGNCFVDFTWHDVWFFSIYRDYD